MLAHELVYGEILIRERGGRLPLLESFKLLKWVMGIPHEEVVDFVRHHKLHGLGAGWVDVHLLASAVAGGHQLWTADPRLHELAKRFRVAYDAR